MYQIKQKGYSAFISVYNHVYNTLDEGSSMIKLCYCACGWGEKPWHDLFTVYEHDLNCCNLGNSDMA